ncbi:uncharacterized protein BKA78DRAFT_314626 [Phyllosticta capitalensis]|uniref:uncharacterized protein n=1 Tax=Phyllosticta capitalensis TaxID=121624 RepID=UPI003130965B
MAIANAAFWSVAWTRQSRTPESHLSSAYIRCKSFASRLTACISQCRGIGERPVHLIEAFSFDNASSQVIFTNGCSRKSILDGFAGDVERCRSSKSSEIPVRRDPEVARLIQHKRSMVLVQHTSFSLDFCPWPFLPSCSLTIVYLDVSVIKAILSLTRDSGRRIAAEVVAINICCQQRRCRVGLKGHH